MKDVLSGVSQTTNSENGLGLGAAHLATKTSFPLSVTHSYREALFPRSEPDHFMAHHAKAASRDDADTGSCDCCHAATS
jgi:hypothetical protein